jgi:hypothetical protein
MRCQKILKVLGLFLGGAVAFSAAPTSPPAVFSWEAGEQNITTKPGQETASAVYVFRNVTDHLVRVMNINSGCTCTNAKTDKEAYAPGERGELKVDFALEERIGRQERVITVVTDDPVSPLASVTLNVEIPELAVIRPRLLFWSIGAKPETKIAEITLTNPENSRLGPPEIENSRFTTKLQPTNRAGVYRLEVTPTSTAESFHAAIHFSASLQGARQTLTIFAAVK